MFYVDTKRVFFFLFPCWSVVGRREMLVELHNVLPLNSLQKLVNI